MIAAIVAHLGIGVGALVCQRCSKRVCTCQRDTMIVTGIFLVVEAIASVLVIDHIFHV